MILDLYPTEADAIALTNRLDRDTTNAAGEVQFSFARTADTSPGGAVQDQIDDTVKDAILRARALTPSGESAVECDDCGAPIPKKRREVLPGVRTCIACQSERDKAVVHSTINRRGSKDSQLR